MLNLWIYLGGQWVWWMCVLFGVFEHISPHWFGTRGKQRKYESEHVLRSNIFLARVLCFRLFWVQSYVHRFYICRYSIYLKEILYRPQANGATTLASTKRTRSVSLITTLVLIYCKHFFQFIIFLFLCIFVRVSVFVVSQSIQSIFERVLNLYVNLFFLLLILPFYPFLSHTQALYA